MFRAREERVQELLGQCLTGQSGEGWSEDHRDVSYAMTETRRSSDHMSRA